MLYRRMPRCRGVKRIVARTRDKCSGGAGLRRVRKSSFFVVLLPLWSIFTIVLISEAFENSEAFLSDKRARVRFAVVETTGG